MPKKNTNQETNNPAPEKPEFFSQKVPDTLPSTKQSSKKKPVKTSTKNIQAQISSIYENADSFLAPPPPSSKKTKILTVVILILAFLSAVSWSGFFLFGRGSKFDENKIQLSAQVAEKSVFGEDLTYHVKIKNGGGINLNNALLSLRYPQGFEFKNSEPVGGTDNKEWQLGTINPGQEIKIDVTGTIWENSGSENSLQMILSYRPGDLNVEFQKVGIFEEKLNPPQINLAADLPTEGYNGTEIPLNISLTNQTNKDLNNLELSLILPEGFKNNTDSWKENKLPLSLIPSSSSTSVSALLLPTAGILPGNQQIQINLQGKKNNKSYLLQSITKEININKSNLSLAVSANGESEKQTVNFGDKVSFLMIYENNGNTDLKNVVLRLILDTPSADNKSLFDWTQIQDKNDGIITAEQLSPQIRRAVITWNKNQIPQLATLKPNTQDSLEVTLPLKQKNSLNLSKLTESRTTVYVEAIINDQVESSKTNLQSNTLELILNSDLNLSSSATFKESKNLPLQVGKNEYDTKTIYTVSWEITNSLHELTDLQLTATLPENVDWEKSATATAGDIIFDATTKQIVWKLNRLPTTFPKVTVNFDLGLKSSDQDNGKQMVLLEKTRVEAKDKVTEENILFWKDPIITLP